MPPPTRYLPPDAVRLSCATGLALVREGFGGKGLRPATLTQAKTLSAGRGLTYDAVRVNLAWFARFARCEHTRLARQRDPKSPAMVSWLLHGGDAGHEWVREIIEDDPPLPMRKPRSAKRVTTKE